MAVENYNLLVDCGDGISKALLTQNISFNSINGILITHLHPDHFSGIATLIVQMKMYDRINRLDIFVNSSLTDVVKNFIFQSYLFQEKMDFEMNFVGFDENKSTTINKYFRFISKQNSHLTKYEKYDYNNELSFSCSSFLFKAEDKNIFYSGDIGGKNDLFLFNDFNFDLFITEITHFEKGELAEALRKLNPAKVCFTHISDDDENEIEKLTAELNREEKGKFVVANDGLTIQI